jgi:hypothetical protein
MHEINKRENINLDKIILLQPIPKKWIIENYMKKI